MVLQWRPKNNMKKLKAGIIKTLIIALITSLHMVLACTNDDPTEQQIYRLIKDKTLIAKIDSLELKTISVLSSTWVDNDYKAMLKIDFMNSQESFEWSGKSDTDFLSAGQKIKKGMNSVKVTATFGVSYAGDGSFYIKSFSF